MGNQERARENRPKQPPTQFTFALKDQSLPKRLDYSPDELEDIGNGMAELINLCQTRDITTVFFLDRSARPAGLLFRDIWRELAAKNEGMAKKPPKIRFMNIGREVGGASAEKAKYNIRKWSSAARTLRKYYGNLEGENVLIADDFSRSGNTLRHANAVFKNAFPDTAHVDNISIFSYPYNWGARIDSYYDLGVGELIKLRKERPPMTGFTVEAYRRYLTKQRRGVPSSQMMVDLKLDDSGRKITNDEYNVRLSRLTARSRAFRTKLKGMAHDMAANMTVMR